jgi:hypothetical protein
MFSKINTAGTKSTGTKRCFARPLPNDLIDFASNDYLGFSVRNYFLTTQYLIKNKFIEEAATVPSFYLGTKSCIETEILLLISIKQKQR